MTELKIIDMHTHVQRNDQHGHEIRDYFLGPALVKPGAPNLGTVPEVRELMAHLGISAVNMLMFTWSGRYLRDGRHTREGAAALARGNNDWAASVVAANDDFTYFAGVNPVVLGAEGAVEEIVRQRAQGAVGVKLVPSDMGIPGEDRSLFPLYEYCVQTGFPVLTETGGHSPHCRPAGFTGALEAFPDLRLVFAHCGHDRELGGQLDAEVLELAARFDGVHGDTSLRLHEVADGVVTPDEMVAFLRRIGTDRVMFGTNYLFCDVLPLRPTDTPVPDHVDPRFAQAWKSVETLKQLPLTDDERQAVAAGNFTTLIGG